MSVPITDATDKSLLEGLRRLVNGEKTGQMNPDALDDLAIQREEQRQQRQQRRQNGGK